MDTSLLAAMAMSVELSPKLPAPSLAIVQVPMGQSDTPTYRVRPRISASADAWGVIDPYGYRIPGFSGTLPSDTDPGCANWVCFLGFSATAAFSGLGEY
jgi:hypothetical protein